MKTIFHSTLVLVALMACQGLRAQALLLASHNGSTTSYTLSNLRSVVFHNNNIIVNDVDCEAHHHSVFFTDYMTLDGTINTSEVIDNPLQLFPIPTESILKLAVNTGEIGQINIFNTTGQMIMSRQINTRQASLEIGDLAPGVYVLVAQGKTTQFIKQ
jgi:hypothetical protein